jgi:hypothetical protein
MPSRDLYCVCVTEPCRYADPNRYDDDEQLRFLTVHLKSLGKLNYQSAMGWLIFIHTAKSAYFKFQILMKKGLVDSFKKSLFLQQRDKTQI